ncbi:hypothetical protein Pan153_13980 [Gimesia panareensis]|uniref:DUF1570 domain-containing protein n=1 Tax=Gimesia panareensis TaxID=2527978 RepID=A0A518FKA5_9PLAN|nr:hypothetical protein [Gimesia panareensis]QDV16766.1 hypothetical protein Pan153_13980 [Gimesia panareensis]
MSIHRSTLLIAGPLVLITGIYLLVFSGTEENRAVANVIQLSPPESWQTPPARQTKAAPSQLQVNCESKAQAIQQRISIPTNRLVKAPYVLIGDYEISTLEALYRKAIQPTEYALNVSYFDTRPEQPITIVALSSQERYQQVAWDLDQRKTGSYYGYFQSDDLRIVLNLTTGSGTLGHELTHALAEIDFPAMPEWFDEGLASLHEQCEFSEQGNRLLGTTNWRVQILISALDRQQLPGLNDLVSQTRIRTDREALTYAYARCFCLFLQQKQLLSPFYRKLRTNQAADPTGQLTLCQILNVDDLSAVDAEFREWLAASRRKTGSL